MPYWIFKLAEAVVVKAISAVPTVMLDTSTLDIFGASSVKKV